MDSLPSQRYGSAAAAATPQRSDPLWLTQKTVCRFRVKEKKDERELSPNCVSNIYIVLPLEICQNSGKWAQASTDPIGAGIALRSGSINFNLKMLLLDYNIYSMTTRPHHESRLVAIISWLRAPKIQTPRTPGNARWESWHAGTWVTLWWMGKWWNTEAPWPPQQTVPPPLRRTDCITFTASGLGKMSTWCSKTAESAARCSIKPCLLHQGWQFHVLY